jgi:hypothetical protein
MRVTGGNSAPNGQKGSPRLNTVWYSNFSTGASALDDVDFGKPKQLCIPVGMDSLKEFLGLKEEVTLAHMRDPEVQRRVHYMPHATPAKADLRRAHQKRPRAEASGASFGEAMAKLTQLIKKEQGLVTRPCSSFSLEELHELQRELFAARSPELQALYKGDRRSLRYGDEAVLSGAHAEAHSWVQTRPGLLNKLRDGLCHELVMMYVHHLSASARTLLKDGSFMLPLLPEGGLHTVPPAAQEPGEEALAEAAAHNDYVNKTSCAICHVSGSSVPATEYITI